MATVHDMLPRDKQGQQQYACRLTEYCVNELAAGISRVCGRQVFLSYGPLPNLCALLFYGFALEDNPHDTLALTFEARPNQLK